MTRIQRSFGASLAQNDFNQRNRWSNPDQARAETANADRRRAGNRRMGDRRAENRAGGGRRATDRNANQAATPWISASLSAHLIGQAEPVATDARQAAKTYAPPTPRRTSGKGGLV